MAASLGPDLVGQPSFAQHARLPGDRIYLGSDGVFDVYSDAAAFWGSEFEVSTSKGMSPEICLTEWLNKCAQHTAFDDNMTVAYMATPLKAVATPTPAKHGRASAAPALGLGYQSA